MILLANVLAPKGVKGNLKIRVFTQDPVFITRCPFITNIEKKIFQFHLVGLTNNPEVIEVRCSGIHSRDTAYALKGMGLYTLVEYLEVLPQDQYYWQELESYTVSYQGTILGKVLRVENFGATDLLEIIPLIEHKSSIYLPFDKNFVDDVCKVQRIIQCTSQGEAWIKNEL